MGFWDYFIIIAVAVALVAAVYFSHSRKKKCGGCCGGCSGACQCCDRNKSKK